jgi:hypothetical protein
MQRQFSVKKTFIKKDYFSVQVEMLTAGIARKEIVETLLILP